MCDQLGKVHWTFKYMKDNPDKTVTVAEAYK